MQVFFQIIHLVGNWAFLEHDIICEISGNNITYIDSRSIGNYTEVIALDLSHNSLATMAIELMDKFPVLQTLNLSSNQLERLTDQSDECFGGRNDTSLEVIDLANNFLKFLPIRELARFQSLQILNMSWNQVSIS